MTRDEALKIFDAMVAACPEITRKGKTMPYTSDNGYMFSLVNKDNEIGIRLAKEDGKVFMAETGADIFKSHGAVMRDYVKVPAAMLNDIEALAALLRRGHAHVTSLPPK